MAKWVNTSVLDAALDKINTANNMSACSNQPANRTDAVTTMMLSIQVMAGGDFTKAAGDTNGRKTTVAQKTGVSVTNNGTANHVALTDAGNLLYVTTATAQALTAGNTMTFNAWKVEFADPT